MVTKKLVTIITESILEPMLIKDFESFGVKGYTVFEARGRGSRGFRHADWEQDRNIRIEVICDQQSAEAIAEHCQRTYYENYAMVVYFTEVQVIRPEKF